MAAPGTAMTRGRSGRISPSSPSAMARARPPSTVRAREAMTSRAQGVVTCAAMAEPAQAMAAPKRAKTISRAPVKRPSVAIHCRLPFAS